MKIAYSYGRFSTAAQGKEGRDSKRRQLASSKSWCEKNGYTLSDEKFFDSNKSGFTGEHIDKDGDLTRFIKLVQTGEIPRGAVLIIDSVDRFSRLPPTRSLELFLSVINAGIGLVFSGSYVQDIITREVLDEQPNILQFIIGEIIRSYRESAEKSRKVKEALAERKAKMKRGEIVAHNNIPLYFEYDKNAKRYIEHPENAPIVKELVQGILAGKSLYGLALDLNKRGIKTFRRGDYWAGTSIRTILQSRTLLGEFLGVKNFLSPIIDEETFNRVQTILRSNRVYGLGKKANLPNIFKGVCYCAHCNHVMNVNTQTLKGVEYRYLVCSARSISCPNKSLRLAEVEEEFFLNYLIQEPDTLVNEDERKELKELRTQKVAVEAKLASLAQQIDKLLAISEGIEMPELKKKLAKLNSERLTANSEIDGINNQIHALADAPNVRDEAQEILNKVMSFGDGVNVARLPNLERDFANLLPGNTSDEQIEKALGDPATRGRLLLAALLEYEHSASQNLDKEALTNPANWPRLLIAARRAFAFSMGHRHYPNSSRSRLFLATRIALLDSQKRVKEALADTAMRDKLRLAMPFLIGKMTVDGKRGQFFIFNRAGRMVYESRPYHSNHNCSERWKASLGKWTNRNGKPITRSWMKQPDRQTTTHQG